MPVPHRAFGPPARPGDTLTTPTASLRRAAGLLVGLSALAACATPAPDDRHERALYLDFSRIVETRQAVEWFVDQREVEEVAPSAMRSSCRVDPALQLRVMAWTEQRIADLGGPARLQFKRDGKAMSDLREVVTLERTLQTLQYAYKHDGDCPFWIEHEAFFTGVHNDEGHFVLLLESGGSGAVLVQKDKISLGGGGSGRALAAWGASEYLTLGIGAEVGGNGTISEEKGGKQDVAATVAVGVPLLLRFIYHERLYDLDLAAVNLGTYTAIEFNPGFRVAVGTGLATVRTGWFMPVGVVQLAYEFHPAGNQLPTTHFFRIGSRFGLDVRF